MVQPASDVFAPDATTAGARLPKSPTLAVFLSLVLPGIGQLYVGQPAKAFVAVMALVGCLYGAAEGALLPFLLLLPFLYLFFAFEAYRGAEELNARFLGGPGRRATRTESPWWGLSLTLLGVLLLLHNLGWLDLVALQRFWPVVLIVAGLASLSSSLTRRDRGPEQSV